MTHHGLIVVVETSKHYDKKRYAESTVWGRDCLCRHSVL